MKSCELCKSPAKIYCDSDQASLCWTCDRKVHSANFLVARHSRSLLCRVCQSPTPWTASGEKLVPSAISICEKCVVDRTSDGDDGREESHGGNDDGEYDGDEDGENELDVDDEDDGDENQVVPLSYTPPPAASSSSSDDYSVGDRGVSVKRKRENVADLSSPDDVDCLSVQKRHRVSAAEFSEAVKGNGWTLYHFLPLSSEAMGEKLKSNRHRNMISGENKSGTLLACVKEQGPSD
ncbi:hypothetical protein L1987_16909 [Smallanthus sonchifolius]|uniref:Uncharacterized protein n=1 Tax=Smallanthus sonchifolius TaxID=185202 RepID=A0ACB9IYV9_9ASTR|nr:hypothetical protein L1987_16909 [Smallanthus sonchifolius]